MSCSCCSTGSCGPSASGGSPASRVPSGLEKRARREIRLLAARFISSSVLFAVALGIQFLQPAFIPGSALIVLPRVLFVFSWLISGYRVLYSALRNIVRGQVFDENFLMSVATIGAFIIGQWSEGAAVMLFFNLGEMVQESAVNRSRRSITDLVDVRPDSARLAESGEIRHPAEVPEGSVIRVLPGEKIPLDGIVTAGSSSADTSRLTGENLPREIIAGSAVLAGFVNGGGLLEIRTTSTYGETAAAKMLNLIEEAQNRKARAEKMITSFAKIYTPIVTVSALLLALLPPTALFLLGRAEVLDWALFSMWVSRALVFLVISCPCAFVISVPLGYFGGIGGAASLGVLVKGADFIDVLAKAKTVVFDKTGTLTKGVFAVRSVRPADGIARERLLELALAGELHSTHPAAVAVRKFAEAEGLSVSDSDITEYSEKAGYGVSAAYKGERLLVGSLTYLRSAGVAVPDDASSSGDDGTLIAAAAGSVYLGSLVLGDMLKSDVPQTVSSLKSLGIERIVMISGDTEPAVAAMAKKAGIVEWHSAVLPHEKVALFERIQSETKLEDKGRGTAVFVGDGINDAPVLARSDAGIAMGALGSDAAVEAADVVLMNDNPLSVSWAIQSARWTRRIVAGNIVLSFAVKLAFLVLGAFGIATLWEAVFADVGVALLATLNSLRARRVPSLKGVSAGNRQSR